MSLTLLNKKFEALNEREKKLRQTFDVRGTNKNQHRYIKDLKEDFKEDLILRYGNKPYGLGWNQEDEDEEKELDEQEPEDIPDDDEASDIEKENEDIMTANIVANNNFRPISGKNALMSSPKNRPFSAASSIRPVTASSTRSPQGNVQFANGLRPISAISKSNKFIKSGMDLSLSTSKTPQHLLHRPESNTAHQQHFEELTNEPTEQIIDDTMFWKNTKKYDISKSTKTFDTKQLLFDMNHKNPKLITSGDLAFLREAKVAPVLNASKLVAPTDHGFHEIAIGRPKYLEDLSHPNPGSQPPQSNYELPEEESEAKITFNQSLSYIQHLRVDTPNGSKLGSSRSHHEFSIKQKKQQRPVTAHPLTGGMSSKQPLETISEQENVKENRRTYFSSLSDLRKRTMFLKMNSLEPVLENHPNSNKELRMVEWETFRELLSKEDNHSLYLFMLDLNTFDFLRLELQFEANGKLLGKDKENRKDVYNLFKDFTSSTRTNLGLIVVYYETVTNKMVEIFNRVMVYEHEEEEYDLMIWKNIYKYFLHKIILSNTLLFPECKSYQDYSRLIKEVLEDKNDYIHRIAQQVNTIQGKPIVVERNSHVYNFDLHSYILECSSHYSKALARGLPKPEEFDTLKTLSTQPQASLNKKPRPFSAVDPKNRLNSPSNAYLHRIQEHGENVLNESSNFFEPTNFISPANKLTSPAYGSRPGTAEVNNRLANNTEAGHTSSRVGSTLAENTQVRRPQSSIPSRMQTLKNGFDMTLKGDRLEIGGTGTYLPYTMDSLYRGDYNRNYQGMGTDSNMPYSYGRSQAAVDYLKSQQYQDMFQQDPNGLVMRYKQAVLKKKPNPMTIKRPQSAIVAKSQPVKTNIRPHNAGVDNKKVNISGFGVSGSRFKY